MTQHTTVRCCLGVSFTLWGATWSDRGASEALCAWAVAATHASSLLASLTLLYPQLPWAMTSLGMAASVLVVVAHLSTHVTLTSLLLLAQGY